MHNSDIVYKATDSTYKENAWHQRVSAETGH